MSRKINRNQRGKALLRINASLDLDTVLGEVAESARALTGARWGVIATVDEEGAPLDFVFSGFTPDEEREFLAWSEQARLFEHFRKLPGTLRVHDLSTHVRALGIEPRRAFRHASLRSLRRNPSRRARSLASVERLRSSPFPIAAAVTVRFLRPLLPAMAARLHESDPPALYLVFADRPEDATVEAATA